MDPVYATAGSRKDAFIRDAYGALFGERTSASGIGWYITDALSSIYGVTVSSGAVLPDVTDYGDFGLQHKDTRFNFTYTGQRADMSNNGLVNYYARSYSPMSATWMQADQYRGDISGPNTLHRYLFVGANPTTLIDALGYNWFTDGVSKAWNATKKAAKTAWNATTNYVSQNAGAIVGTAIGIAAGACIIATAGLCAGVGLLAGMAIGAVGLGAGMAFDTWHGGGSGADIAKAGGIGAVTGALSVIPVGRVLPWLAKTPVGAAAKALQAKASSLGIVNLVTTRASAGYDAIRKAMQNTWGAIKNGSKKADGVNPAPANCFTAGTLILLGDGTRRSIEDIRVGDQVTTTDTQTGVETPRTVTQLFERDATDLYEITAAGATTIGTSEHPFYVQGKGWTPVKDLQVGDLLVQPNDTVVPIENIQPLATTATVYNFEVETAHNYYIQHGSAWTLVHNACQPSHGGNSASSALPIGPAEERVWTVLDRVDAKGAPLPGHKGGKAFGNTDGKLPQKPGVTYREWDVNPNIKGVDRGGERLVTGSDGSAYFTTDHYDSFMTVRVPTA